MNALGRVIRQAGQHVGKPSLWIDVVELGGGDEGVDGRDRRIHPDVAGRPSRRARAGRRAAAEERLNHHGSMQSFDHSGSTDLELRLR